MSHHAQTHPEPTSRALKRVKRGALCSGCGGCAFVASDKIRIAKTAQGFLRPVQTAELSEQEEQEIADMCPGLGQTVDPKGRQDDAIWGPYLSLSTGHAPDPDLRHQASSGGALSAVLVHLLETKQVDEVLQIAADPDNPVGNIVQFSRNASEVQEASGSRYAPSAPLAALPEVLKRGSRFAFVGKPCDVAAMRALMERDKVLADRCVVVLSFFCGGVPSEVGAFELVTKMGADPATLAAFRYRGFGWPGMARATDQDGSFKETDYSSSWRFTLSKRVQHRCRICADGTGKAADIVFADAWEADARGFPLFEDQEGRSLVMARTAKGEAIVGRTDLSLAPYSPDTLLQVQPGQRDRCRALVPRLLGLRVLGKPVPRYRGLHLIAAMRQNSVKVLMRTFFGTLRRVLTVGLGRYR